MRKKDTITRVLHYKPAEQLSDTNNYKSYIALFDKTEKTRKYILQNIKEYYDRYVNVFGKKIKVFDFALSHEIYTEIVLRPRLAKTQREVFEI